ncbi:hypothetical protein BGZ47_009418 [Haplosporangium gracile]|nr:hypothetical protein BGZ47_009418 [Haplosporangium gracile]
MDTDMTPASTSTATTPPNPTQATPTTSHAQQTHTRSSSNSSTYTNAHGTTEIGGMSINLPFSSFTSGPTELAQHTATSLAGPSNTTQSSQSLSSDAGTDNLTTPSGAQPMAIKPVYKKRAYPSTQRPDGIIKKTRVAAAEEKTQVRQAIENAAKSRGNIYDRTTRKTRSRAPSITSSSHAAEPLESPAKKQRVQKPKKVKIVKPRKQPKPTPPKKPKVVKPPRIWTPHQPRNQQQQTIDEQPPAPAPQEDISSNHSNPPGTLEILIKQHDAHQERLSQLATRPLPLHELQMLVCTELEQEHETLKSLGIMLHKELLKLRLEEGVMLNMLKISEGGVLDVTDLERIRARKPPSARQLQAYDRMNERHYQKRLRTAKAARAAAIAMRAAMGIQTETTKEDAILAQDQPRVRTTRKRQPVRKSYETDDDNEDDQGEEHGEHYREERADEEETDADSERTRPRYQAPGESYLFRPVNSSSQLQDRSDIGRPEASSAPAFVSLEEIKNLVVKRAHKRTADDMIEQEVDDDDLYELEFDEDEVQAAKGQRGRHDDDEVDQHTDMDMDVDNQNGDDDDGEGKEGEEGEEGEEEEDVDEDEYYSSDEDGEGPGGNNEEDEDAARLALQRMLSIYGGI